NFTDPSGAAYQLAYNIYRYELGVTFSLHNSPLFFEGGALGESLHNKRNAPIDATNFGPYIGIGLKIP
ncbi:MAG TPA: hypothetical protein VF741_01035, partial [Candidatus Aquilonibacter sp.]